MGKCLKVTTITTVNHNIGDDFVREGILYFLERHFGLLDIKNINKHFPVSVRDECDWLLSSGIINTADRFSRLMGRVLSKGIDLLPLNSGKDKILRSDILIQCGAPVFWCNGGNHCSDNEWWGALIEKRYRKIREQVVFFNIAAGSCQPYFSDGSEVALCNRCGAYIKKFYDLAEITTVRDELSKNILNLLGLDAPLIPCPSIFAADRLEIKAEDPQYVCLNYMEGGGHYNFGQNIDVMQWRRAFKDFYYNIKNNFNCVFVCHNQKEVRDAKKIDSSARIFIAKDYHEYLKFYARAKYGVVNRVHAAFAMAGFGRPSIVIGSDSRARMSDQLGLKNFFVSNVYTQMLLEEFQGMVTKGSDYRDILIKIKEKACSSYLEILSRMKDV